MMFSKKVVLPNAVLIGIISISASTSLMAAESQCDSYEIQMIATSVSSKADKMKSTLVQNGFRGAVSLAENNGKELHRVRVGPYEDKAAARRVQEQLKTDQLGADNNILLKGKAPCSKLIVDSNGGEVKFKRGSSSMLMAGGIGQGDEPNTYTLMAGAGQWMEVKVSSKREKGKNNADFRVSVQSATGEEIQLKGFNGRDYWLGQLPSPGYLKDGKSNAATITVTGIDNASYHMNVAVKNRNWTQQAKLNK